MKMYGLFATSIKGQYQVNSITCANVGVLAKEESDMQVRGLLDAGS